MAMWEGYRQSKIGDCLVDSLDVLISQSKLTPDHAIRVLEEFDKTVLKHLSNSEIKATIKGDLHTYRSYDDVYNLVVENAVITFSKGQEKQELKTEAIKLVCQDAKVVLSDKTKNE